MDVAASGAQRRHKSYGVWETLFAAHRGHGHASRPRASSQLRQRQGPSKVRLAGPPVLESYGIPDCGILAEVA